MQDGVAVITGAGRGIGRAIALDLAKEHFSLGLVGRDTAELSKVAHECRASGAKAEYYSVDLTKIEQLPDLISKIAQDFGGINVLVNNAGVWIEKSIREASLEEWNRSLDLNLRAIFALCKLALPHLEKADRAAIINISSTAGQRTYPGGTMYCATKHGLAGLSAALFQDLRELGIKVCAISPGHVNTSMHKDDSTLDPEKMIQADDIARTVRFVLDFPKSGCPTEITIMPQRSPKIKTMKEK